MQALDVKQPKIVTHAIVLAELIGPEHSRLSQSHVVTHRFRQQNRCSRAVRVGRV